MRSLLILLATASMSGCAVFNDQYTCGEVPGTGCAPVSEVYDRTSGDVYDYRKDMNKSDSSSNNQSSAPVITVASAHRVINFSNPGDPILSKPVVMRVLYRSFENDQKDLDAGGYTFLRMRDSEWLMTK